MGFLILLGFRDTSSQQIFILHLLYARHSCGHFGCISQQMGKNPCLHQSKAGAPVSPHCMRRIMLSLNDSRRLLGLGDVRFKMCINHLSGDAKQSVPSKHLEFRREVHVNMKEKISWTTSLSSPRHRGKEMRGSWQRTLGKSGEKGGGKRRKKTSWGCCLESQMKEAFQDCVKYYCYVGYAQII